jgi:hypothetical protein
MVASILASAPLAVLSVLPFFILLMTTTYPRPFQALGRQPGPTTEFPGPRVNANGMPVFKIIKNYKLGMVVHVCNPSI